jgi:transposase
MSKRGSPYLRHALWLAASVAIRHDPDLQAFYQAKRKEGKHHGTVGWSRLPQASGTRLRRPQGTASLHYSMTLLTFDFSTSRLDF